MLGERRGDADMQHTLDGRMSRRDATASSENSD